MSHKNVHHEPLLSPISTALGTSPKIPTRTFESRRQASSAFVSGIEHKVNGRGPGLLSVAVVGTLEVDGTRVDPTSVRLAGVAPLRSSVEDVVVVFE